MIFSVMQSTCMQVYKQMFSFNGKSKPTSSDASPIVVADESVQQVQPSQKTATPQTNSEVSQKGSVDKVHETVKEDVKRGVTQTVLPSQQAKPSAAPCFEPKEQRCVCLSIQIYTHDYS
jgi:hypothetical protein